MDLADRASIVFTMLLTAMAFKFVMADQLPSVPYLTTLDSFMVSSFVVFAVQGTLHWIIAELDMHLCYFDGMDFMWKTVDSGHPNAAIAPNDKNDDYKNGHTHGIWKGREYPYNPTPDLCLPIHFFDRLQMIAHVMFLLVKYVYIVGLYLNSTHQFESDGNLLDTADLDEFHIGQNIQRLFAREDIALSTISIPQEVDSVGTAGIEIVEMGGGGEEKK